MRGLAVPRIIRAPDACLTCRRQGFKCHWGLPTCVTCDENGYKCVQPISTVGYEEYIRDGDAQQPAAEPDTATEEAKTQIKGRPRADDGIIGYNMDLTPIFPTRDLSIPIPEKTATHQCTRQPAPLYASGSEHGAESGVESGAGTASASASGPVAVSESESSSSASASASAPASTTASGSASSGSAFESEFVTRIKKHMYKFQQRELEHTYRYVKRRDSTSFDDVDKDHDYAAYYDYDYDSDPDVVHEEDIDPSKTKSHSCICDLYMVKNSWPGPGEPPLKSRINDYITYMKEIHLDLLPQRVSLPLTLLASCDYTASDTLFYYEKRSANCCVTDIPDIPDINPVNPKLVRLGYTNPLVLQLVIAQRSNHRQVSSAILSTGESADSFLMDAIAQFGPKIDSYLAGGEHEMPSLFVASIVVSLAEVGLPPPPFFPKSQTANLITQRARLDKLSQAYNHPIAAKAILNNLHRLDSEEIFVNMPKYLIEYYMHTVSFACVAASPITAAGVPFISAQQLSFVDSLAADGYIGKLCGSWLDILATIPHIFRLGAIMYRRKLGTSTFQDAPDEFLDFDGIEDRLMGSALYGPGNPTHTYQKIAIIFKIAAVLYLWSLFDAPLLHHPDAVTVDEDANLQDGNYEFENADERRQKMHKVIMKQILRQAEFLLPTVPLEDNLNLALCWPMLILGCFTKEKETKEFIEQRLIAITNQSGVGNSLETLFILKHVWSLPMSKRSPWMIWQYIQDSRCRECTCPQCTPFLF